MAVRTVYTCDYCGKEFPKKELVCIVKCSGNTYEVRTDPHQYPTEDHICGDCLEALRTALNNHYNGE